MINIPAMARPRKEIELPNRLERDKAVLEMVEQGMSVTEIAQELGVATYVASRWLLNMGIQTKGGYRGKHSR